ncbi:hypothetical protein B0T14DRAFT_558048 [Immersiella caudata]|uniref:Uncharacterized protein n=1 Tax=Immersiella caudata TaxID=314043 RepID=A0AA39W496_9PEZI|nr:hypothetical protein B0T14DRAFT_558048 [Immersiella caudata]
MKTTASASRARSFYFKFSALSWSEGPSTINCLIAPPNAEIPKFAVSFTKTLPTTRRGSWGPSTFKKLFRDGPPQAPKQQADVSDNAHPFPSNGGGHPTRGHTQHIGSINQEDEWKVSPNYEDDTTLARNLPAYTPTAENCALFVMGLLVNVTISKILNAIRGTGKAYQVHINPATGSHATAAVKLTSFTRNAAERFFAATRTGFFVKGSRATVVWNQILVPSQVGAAAQKSRVLIINGPNTFVSLHNIIRIMDDLTKFYDLESAFDCPGRVEMRLGAFARRRRPRRP